MFDFFFRISVSFLCFSSMLQISLYTANILILHPEFFLYSSACLFSWSHLLLLEVVLTFFLDWHFYISVPLDLVIKVYDLLEVSCHACSCFFCFCVVIWLSVWMSLIYLVIISVNNPQIWLIEKKTTLFGLRLLVLLLLLRIGWFDSPQPHTHTAHLFLLTFSWLILPLWFPVVFQLFHLGNRDYLFSPWLFSSIVPHRGCFCFTIFRY